MRGMGPTATRQHPRFPHRLPVLCESQGVPGYRTVGITRNVSIGGLMLEAPRPLTPHTPTSLRLLAGDRIAHAEAVVVWMTQEPSSRMGIRFTTWAGTDSHVWDQLLAFQAGQTPRASLRIPITLEVTCVIPPDTRLRGQAKNVSDGGLMVTLPKVFPPQTLVTVEVPSWVTRLPVEAEVMWALTTSEGHDVIHGLRFHSEDVGKELFLVGALLQQLLD